MMRLINGDVLDGLAMLADDSVQCVVTSPPYWALRDYGNAGQIGLDYVGIEINAGDCEATKRRIEDDNPMFNRVSIETSPVLVSAYGKRWGQERTGVEDSV